ncbi:hypothetical protein D9A36_24640 [Vibrio parahaemolyticus]|nr:hypothetical protein [Vibrio parahaemolyticus]
MALSLRSSIAKRRSHLNAALGDGQESSLFFSLSFRVSILAIQHCRLKFSNLSGCKTYQGSQVASLVFAAGWL